MKKTFPISEWVIPQMTGIKATGIAVVDLKLKSVVKFANTFSSLELVNANIVTHQKYELLMIIKLGSKQFHSSLKVYQGYIDKGLFFAGPEVPPLEI